MLGLLVKKNLLVYNYNMAENNLQKPLTLEDLGKFTEEVLLPAIGNMIDAKLEEKLEQKLEEKFEQKLSPIRQEIFCIKEDIKWIKDKIEKIQIANSEDILALDDEIQKLKIRTAELENQVQKLKISR